MWRYIFIAIYKLNIKLDRYTARLSERRYRRLMFEAYELRKEERILMHGGATVFTTGLTALRDEIAKLEKEAAVWDRRQAQCAVRIYGNRRRLRSLGVKDPGPPVNLIPKVPT